MAFIDAVSRLNILCLSVSLLNIAQSNVVHWRMGGNTVHDSRPVIWVNESGRQTVANLPALTGLSTRTS